MMDTWVLLTVFTFVCQGLVQGIPLPSDAKPDVRYAYNGFWSCRLSPNPKPDDLIQYLLCIQMILERECGSADEVGRWGRSVDDKLRREMKHFQEIAELLLSGSDKNRLPRSLEALCAGDLSHYDHEVKEYIQWRCKNGYGTLMRRWGRSSTFKIVGDETIWETKSNAARQRQRWSSFKHRSKRADGVAQGNDMRAIVQAYKEWRDNNGYGQKGGRWG